MLRQSPQPNRGTTGLVWSILLVSTSGCIVGEGGKEDGYGPPHSVPSGGSAGWYEDDPMDDPDDSGTPDGPEVTVTWGEDALHISVEGAPNGLWLGIVETGGSCASAGGAGPVKTAGWASPQAPTPMAPTATALLATAS